MMYHHLVVTGFVIALCALETVAEAANILTGDLQKHGEINPQHLPLPGNKVLDLPSLGLFWLVSEDDSPTSILCYLYWSNTTKAALYVYPPGNTTYPIQPGETILVARFGQGFGGAPDVGNRQMVILGTYRQASGDVSIMLVAEPDNLTCRARIMAIRA